MRFFDLALRSLTYHRRANVAVVLGVVVGTAVLTGALLVGDSLRGSLRQLTYDRLGRIEYALASERFFRADLAERMGKKGTAEHFAAAVILRGTAIRRGQHGNVARAGNVQVVGVDESFWPLFGEDRNDLANQVIINEALAREVSANIGDLIEVRLQKPQAIPSDSLLGRPVKEQSLILEPSPIAEILPNSGAGRFSLTAQQQRPLIVYVQLRRLQNRLSRDGLLPKNPANALLVGSSLPSSYIDLQPSLNADLKEVIELEDMGLSLGPDQTGVRYLSLESRRMIIEPEIADAVIGVAKEAGWQVRPTITYLANVITNNPQMAEGITSSLAAGLAHSNLVSVAQISRVASSYTPYSAITALNPADSSPWGPLPVIENMARPLQEDEILLSEWAAKDLWPFGNWRADIGKPVVTIRYFVEGDGWLLKEESKNLRFAGVVALKGPAADRTLTPEFPGLKGTTVADWEPPFPKEQWHPEWVRPRDEEYWRKYKATPKAFVSPETAQKLWKSRYGRWTSIRIASSFERREPNALAELESKLRDKLRERLSPEAIGLAFQPVKSQGLAAAGSSVAQSFGWLFLGFSFFLIVSAAMLVGLLFRLGIERRAKEIGLLYAAGYRHRSVRGLLFAEGAILAFLGGGVGLGVAVGYAGLLLHALNNWWADSLHTSFLQLHVAPASFPIGFGLSFVTALVAIGWAMRGLKRMSPHGLLAGKATEEKTVIQGTPTKGWNLRIATFSAVTALLLAIFSSFIPTNAAAPLFFVSGICLLASGLAFLSLAMRRNRWRPIEGGGTTAVGRLGARNIQRNSGRSLLTAGLLACAVFLVVAVESFRKSAGGDEGRDSGTGGFSLLAEADVPLFLQPNSPEDRRVLLPDLATDKVNQLNEILAAKVIYGLRVRPGDDVSCLNLYQPKKPRLLGVPLQFIERGGFAFASLHQPTPEEKAIPWRLLQRKLPAGVVPILADEHTATWVLQVGLGDEWTITDERGQEVKVQLVGLLNGSIFQSELLMSEDNFRKLFPSRGGYAFFLIPAAAKEAQYVKQMLENAFGDRFGFNVGRTLDRLAAFQAVENTYLSTFQVLGGLGLLLGSLGLAVVLLRNVWERQAELALLRAVGYPRLTLGWLVLAENGTLLLLGLTIGIVSALLAVTPHLLGQAAQIPWVGVVGLLALVLVVGLAAGGLAVASTLQTPLLPALRRE